MDNQNTGSFGAAIGGGSALVEAMQRRGIDASALQAQSPASAGGAPVPAPLPEDGMQAAQAALPQGAGVTSPAPSQPDSDVTIATKALATMVTNDSKMKKDLATMQSQGVM